MKSLSVRLILSTWLALALTTGVAWAWPEDSFGKIDIRGPGIEGVASVTDAGLLSPMTIEGFMNFSRAVAEPEGLGQGYELHRYFRNKDGSWMDFDRVMYYPDPAGGPGYVQYLEGIAYSPSQHAGRWYRATPAGEAAWQAILTAITVPAPAPLSVFVPAPMILLLSFIVVLALGGLRSLLKTKPIAVPGRR